MCGSTEISISRYSWYAPGFRYPVMTISIVENRYRGGVPEITKTAFVNTQQQRDGSAIASVNQGSQVETSDVSVILFPNPFRLTVAVAPAVLTMLLPIFFFETRSASCWELVDWMMVPNLSSTLNSF